MPFGIKNAAEIIEEARPLLGFLNFVRRFSSNFGHYESITTGSDCVPLASTLTSTKYVPYTIDES